MSLAAVSKHLIVLEKAGLVKRRAQGAGAFAGAGGEADAGGAGVDRPVSAILGRKSGSVRKVFGQTTNEGDQNMTAIKNEIQKPDDATLILKRTLNAPRGSGVQGVDVAGKYPAMDATGARDGGSAGAHGCARGREVSHSDEEAGRRVFHGSGGIPRSEGAGATGLHVGLGEGRQPEPSLAKWRGRRR